MNLPLVFMGVSLWILPLIGNTQLLEQDTILAKYYSKQEIKQMEAILSFFDEHMLSTCQGSHKIAVCYQQLFNRLADPDSFNIGIPFKDQINLYLKELDREVFNSIWAYSPSRARIAGDKLQYYNSISYNPTGRYRKFLKNVSKAEPYFDKYVEPIETAGDLSPSLFKGFLYNPSGLDFNNERHRLILAIHFLTFNDQIATRPS